MSMDELIEDIVSPLKQSIAVMRWMLEHMEDEE